MKRCAPVVVALLCIRLFASQTPVDWGAETAARLASFLPAKIDGLIDGPPWAVLPFDPIGRLWGCRLGCAEYLPVQVSREWSFNDPVLVADVEQAARQALADAAQAAREVVRNGALSPSARAALQKAEEGGRREDDLKRRERLLDVTLDVNTIPTLRRGMEPPPVRMDPIAGYPAFRFAYSSQDFAPITEGVRLVVFLGPETFVVRRVPEADMRREIKTIRVGVAVRSLPETIKADEALARRVLESIDYRGLSALIETGLRTH